MCSERLGKKQYRLEIPSWVVDLFVHMSSRFQNVRVAGFRRGAFWAHDLVKQAHGRCTKALLLAPYCPKGWSPAERLEHAHAVASAAKVLSVYTMADTSCPWRTEAPFIQNAGARMGVTELCASHDSVIEAFKEGKLPQTLEWLLGRPRYEMFAPCSLCLSGLSN